MHYVNAALRAHALFTVDVDYVVKDGQIIIVDEHTGRLMDGRRWSWIGYVISSFLSCYAVPSGVLHWAALIVWSAVVLLLRRDWSGLGWIGGSNLLVGLLVAAVYWPLRQELVAAAA